MTTKELISLPKRLKRAQIIFNRWVRMRDLNSGCISCGAEVTEAGHYYSQGHHSALRFNEANCWGQCIRCNRFLHGNLINYRHGLIKRIGQEKLHLLDSVATRNPVKKWTRFEIEEIIKKYSL